MKKTVFYLLILMVTIVTSCSDDNMFPTVEKENITIYLDYNNLAKIPVPAFTSIVSFDNEIVNAELIEGSFVQIDGIKEGKTIIQTESKKGGRTEISVIVKYALHNKNWTFISSEVGVDCNDIVIKQTIEEDVKQYLISSMKSDGEGSKVVFLADNKLKFKTLVQKEYETIEGTYLYEPADLKLQFPQNDEVQCKFSILERDGLRWLSIITHDLSDIYKKKYPAVVNSVTINYSLEAVDLILDK